MSLSRRNLFRLGAAAAATTAIARTTPAAAAPVDNSRLVVTNHLNGRSIQNIGELRDLSLTTGPSMFSGARAPFMSCSTSSSAPVFVSPTWHTEA